MARILVAGSINMDMVVSAERLPKPGETVGGGNFKLTPGGKGANQAVAAARLGADVHLIGKFGQDSFADELTRFLKAQNVNLEYSSRAQDLPSGTAVVVVAENAQNMIVVVPGANGLLNTADVEKVNPVKGDLLLSQFEVPFPTITRFFQLGRAAGAKTILNPAPAKPCPRELLSLADIVVLNETELTACLSVPINDWATSTLLWAARQFRAYPEQIIDITLGANGVIALEGEQEIHIKGHKVAAVDTTGAGDCFVGALATQLAAGEDLETALRFANLAASICVKRAGASAAMPTMSEVEQMLASS